MARATRAQVKDPQVNLQIAHPARIVRRGHCTARGVRPLRPQRGLVEGRVRRPRTSQVVVATRMWRRRDRWQALRHVERGLADRPGDEVGDGGRGDVGRSVARPRRGQVRSPEA